MAVAGNDHQFARGPGSLESSRLRQPRGRDMSYRLLQEYETDIENARIESLECAKVGRGARRDGRMEGGSDAARQADRSRALGLRVTNALTNGRSVPPVAAVQ